MKIDRDTPCELYSWYETRRIIAEICGVLSCIPSAPLEGCFWFQVSVVDAEGGESLGFSISSQKLHMPSTFLCF